MESGECSLRCPVKSKHGLFSAQHSSWSLYANTSVVWCPTFIGSLRHSSPVVMGIRLLLPITQLCSVGRRRSMRSILRGGGKMKKTQCRLIFKSEIVKLYHKTEVMTVLPHLRHCCKQNLAFLVTARDIEANQNTGDELSNNGNGWYLF